MKYIRTKNGIITSSKATHELVEDICCAGYLRTLEKGAYVRIGREWINFYGRWVDIIDENGVHYSIKPNEVERVTRELPQADTIEELIDTYIVIPKEGKPYMECKKWDISDYKEVYAAIWTTGEHGEPILKSVAKMNEKGELELL